MRSPLALAAVALAIPAVTLLGPPAEAQNVTFTLTGGGITISAPSADAALTGGVVGSVVNTSLSGSLGSTTVTDARGGVTGWTSTITGSAFTSTNGTIPVSAAKVFVAAPIVPTGIAVVTSGTYVSEATGLTLSATAQPFVTATAVVGNNAATFNPTIAVAIPSNAVAGTYTGVVTQTVS